MENHLKLKRVLHQNLRVSLYYLEVEESYTSFSRAKSKVISRSNYNMGLQTSFNSHNISDPENR